MKRNVDIPDKFYNYLKAIDDRELSNAQLISIVRTFMAIIHRAPSTTGTWIKEYEGPVGWRRLAKCICSNCGKDALKRVYQDMDGVRFEFCESDFCPSCGSFNGIIEEASEQSNEPWCGNCIHRFESEPTVDNCACCYEMCNYEEERDD